MVGSGGLVELASDMGREYKNGSVSGSEWCQMLHKGLWSLEG